LYLVVGNVRDANRDIVIATALVGQSHQLPGSFGGRMSTGDIGQLIVTHETSQSVAAEDQDIVWGKLTRKKVYLYGFVGTHAA
jgi:hypothetical protein